MAHRGGTVTGNVYDKYGARNPIARWLMQGFHRQLARLLAATGAPGRVLEVGCGEGHITQFVHDRLPQAELFALDLDAELVGQTEGRCPQAQCVVGDAQALPWPDGHFDLVLGIEVLEHVPDPARAVAEMARVSRRYIIASVPNEPLWRVLNLARGAYIAGLGNTPGHINHWGARGFRRLMERHFDIIDLTRPLPWLMALGRKRG